MHCELWDGLKSRDQIRSGVSVEYLKSIKIYHIKWYDSNAFVVSMIYADIDDATILEHTIEHQISICRPLFHWGWSTSLVGSNSGMVVSKWGMLPPKKDQEIQTPDKTIDWCKTWSLSQESRAKTGHTFAPPAGEYKQTFWVILRQLGKSVPLWFVEVEVLKFTLTPVRPYANWNWKRWELIFWSRFSAAFCHGLFS